MLLCNSSFTSSFLFHILQFSHTNPLNDPNVSRKPGAPEFLPPFLANAVTWSPIAAQFQVNSLTGLLPTLYSAGKTFSNVFLLPLPFLFSAHSILYMAISLVFLWCPPTQITQVILLLKTSQHFLITSKWKSRLLSLAFKYFEGGCSLWPSRIPAHPYWACQPHSLTVLWLWGVSVASHMATM